MQVKRIASYDELAALAQPWRALCDEAPFARPEWLLPWFRHLPQRGVPFAVAVFDGDRLVALAPWIVESTPVLGRTLRFAGERFAATDHLYLPHVAARRAEAIAALVSWLLDARGDDGWDALHLDGGREGAACLEELARRLIDAGGVSDAAPPLATWRVELPDAWDDYVATLKPQFRRKVRLAFKPAAANRLVVAKTPDQRRETLAKLVELHSARRNSLGESGCFATPGFFQFLEGVLEAFPDDATELVRLEIEGSTAAAALTLLSDESRPVQYFYQCGVDPARMQRQPGWRLNALLIHSAIERGFRAFDYLRGDEDYKRRLGCQPHAIGRLRISSPRRSSQIRERIWSTLAAVKHWATPVPTSIG